MLISWLFTCDSLGWHGTDENDNYATDNLYLVVSVFYVYVSYMFYM